MHSLIKAGIYSVINQRIAFTDCLPQDVKAFTAVCNDLYPLL